MNIRNIFYSLSTLLVVVLFSACEDPDKAPIVTFDSAGKGAYPRLLGSQGEQFVNILTEADFNSSSFSFEIEFVDGQQGARITEYVLNAEYVDVTGANSQEPKEFTRIPASSFESKPSGSLGVSAEVTGPALAAAFGLTYTDLTAGDEFRLTGQVVADNGTFTGDNSSATVQGAAFQGFFDFNMGAACPSDLTGEYAYSTTDIWCDGSSTSGTVTIDAQGGGVYKFSDWAFGSYGTCYGGGTAGGDLTFTEVCEVVSFTGFTDSFGDTWTYNSSISGEQWTIAWDNTYGESATSVITFPGGVPFTLAP